MIARSSTHHAHGLPRRRSRGMTLMELLVVIGILGIVAAVAVPTYRKYLLRSQRTEAKIALLQLQTAQEKHYLQYNAYTDKVTTATTAASPGLGLPGVSETNKYDIKVTTLGGGGQSYTATASPHAGGGQEDDKDCGNFTIDDRGRRGNSTGSSKVEACWK